MGRLKVEWRLLLFWLLLFTIVFSATVGFLMTIFSHRENDLGVRVVETMYSFEDLEGLEKQYNNLSFLLDEGLWEDFTLNNDSRIISVYYKFQGSKSEVEFIYVSDSVIMYHLKNDYINPDRVFVFEYETNGKVVTAIREYELLGICDGVEGVLS